MQGLRAAGVVICTVIDNMNNKRQNTLRLLDLPAHTDLMYLLTKALQKLKK